MGKAYKLMTAEEKAHFNSYCIQRWRDRKLFAIEYKGGKCESCGYDKCPDVLEFHHLDPSNSLINLRMLAGCFSSPPKSYFDIIINWRKRNTRIELVTKGWKPLVLPLN